MKILTQKALEQITGGVHFVTYDGLYYDSITGQPVTQENP